MINRQFEDRAKAYEAGTCHVCKGKGTVYDVTYTQRPAQVIGGVLLKYEPGRYDTDAQKKVCSYCKETEGRSE